MQKHRGTLPREKRMRHIRHIIRICIANRKDTRHIRHQPPFTIRRELVSVQRDARLSPDVGVLLRGEISKEGIPQHGVLAIFKIHLEEIVLGVRGETRVRVGTCAVAEPGDGCQGAVLDAYVLQLEVRLPAGELGGGDVAVLGGVGTVHEEHDVGVESEDLADGRHGAVEAGEDAEILVGVLVAVAPGTPVYAFAPVLLDAFGGREDVAHTGSEDDFPGCERDGFVARVVGKDLEEGVVVLWLHCRDGAVDEVYGAIFADLLAGCEAEPGWSHAVETEDVMSVSCGIIAVFA